MTPTANSLAINSQEDRPAVPGDGLHAMDEPALSGDGDAPGTAAEASTSATPWQEAAPIIRRYFKSNASYQILDHSAGEGGTWTAGGCWIAAEAIKRTFGGSIRAICSQRSGARVEHFVVQKDDHLIDSDGKPHPVEAFVARWGAREGRLGAHIGNMHRPGDPDPNNMGAIPENHVAYTRNSIPYDEWAVTEVVKGLSKALARTRSTPPKAAPIPHLDLTDVPPDGWSTVYHLTEVRSLPAILRDGLAPRIGPRSKSAQESQARIYTFPDHTSLVDGFTNWLAEEFTRRTCVLALKVPTRALAQDEVAWEATIAATVPPSCITVIVPDTEDWNGDLPPEGHASK